MLGILNPVVGALVHNAGSVLVICNSALLLRWNMKKSNSNSVSFSAVAEKDNWFCRLVSVVKSLLGAHPFSRYDW